MGRSSRADSGASRFTTGSIAIWHGAFAWVCICGFPGERKTRLWMDLVGTVDENNKHVLEGR